MTIGTLSERTEPQPVVLIHTTSLVEDIFRSVIHEVPYLDATHWTETSLFDMATSTPGLELDRCVLALQKAVQDAASGGAKAVLVTCSTLGPATDIVDAISSIPVVRIDRAMATEAVQQGNTLGLIATQESNVDASKHMLEQAALEAGKRKTSIRATLLPEAFEALKAGDRGLHDQIIRDRIDSIAPNVDAVVLAQASMASAVMGDEDIPVVTSPVAALKLLAQKAKDGKGSQVPPVRRDLDQLRIYTIRDGLMPMWVEYFGRVIVPLHAAVGLPVKGPWRNTADDKQFVWMRSFSSDGPVAAQEKRFFESPARAALGDVRERYVEKLDVRVMSKI